jgi:para-nitrobenzyl esterase
MSRVIKFGFNLKPPYSPSMKKLTILGLLAFLTTQSILAQCDENRYRVPIFTQTQVQSDITYGQNAIYTGSTQSLKLDVYTPVGDTETNRPLVIMAHGGYFLGGSKTDDTVVPICEGLSKMGYVTASISYRLGVPLVTPLAGPFTEAVMRGVQDMRAAVRFFRKSAAVQGNPYGINPDEIYIGGVSAGGFIALHYAYMDLNEVPANLNWGNQGLSGGIEGNSGNPGYSSEVKGIISIAGAIGDKEWIDADEAPAFLSHGSEDSVVPFDTEMLSLMGIFNVAVVDGSNSIHTRLEQQQITNCFEIYYGQDHLPSNNLEQYFDTTLSIVSGFLSHIMCSSIPLDCEYRQMIASVEDNALDTDMVLYPNPATTVAYLSAREARIIKVMDAMGKNLFVSHNRNSIDLQGIAPGIYLVQIEQNGKQYTRRLVVE